MVVLPPRFLLFYPIQNDHWCPWLVTVKPLPQSWSQTCNVQSLTHFISIYFAINVKKIYICKQIHWILSSILIIPQFTIYFLNTRILANTSLWSKTARNGEGFFHSCAFTFHLKGYCTQFVDSAIHNKFITMNQPNMFATNKIKYSLTIFHADF